MANVQVNIHTDSEIQTKTPLSESTGCFSLVNVIFKNVRETIVPSVFFANYIYILIQIPIDNCKHVQVSMYVHKQREL
jgi:hypothetical protein